MTITKAVPQDIDAIKRIADVHRKELGFSRRPALLKSISQQEILVARQNEQIIGYVEYHHRRDEQTTLHNIVVFPEYRGQDVGRKLIATLQTESQSKNKRFILLKCPVDLPANNFYSHTGFSLVKTEPGKRRQLNIWQLEVKP